MFYLCLSLSVCWGNLRILFKEVWKKTLKVPKKKACLNFPQNSYGESNCTQQVKTLEKRKAMGQYEAKGWDVLCFCVGSVTGRTY